MKDTNASFAAYNQAFIGICLTFNIKPTKRQASKFRMGKGLAWKCYIANSKTGKASN